MQLKLKMSASDQQHLKFQWMSTGAVSELLPPYPIQWLLDTVPMPDANLLTGHILRLKKLFEVQISSI